MKICLLGVGGVDPRLLLGHEKLVNIRRLMDSGLYGQMEEVIPPSATPAWMCTAAGRDAGSIGVYGPSNRIDRSYRPAEPVQHEIIRGLTIGDQLQAAGKTFLIVEDHWKDDFEKKHQDHDGAADFADILAASQRQWDEACKQIEDRDWAYFQVIDRAAERIHEKVRFCATPDNGQNTTENSVQSLILEYYEILDRQIGRVMAMLDQDTALMLLSPFAGRPRLKDLFTVNDWLIDQQLLVLKDKSTRLPDFDPSLVDWEKTQVWSEGDAGTQIFLNVRDRESQGVVPHSDYESFRNEISNRLIRASQKLQLEIHVLKPEEAFCELRNIPPDLLMYPRSYSSRSGVFAFASPNSNLRGEYKGATFLDIAPTLLELSGCEITNSMPGHSLLNGMDDNFDTETILHDRLAGLGYV